jgi:hypothetical protein
MSHKGEKKICVDYVPQASRRMLPSVMGSIGAQTFEQVVRNLTMPPATP